MKDTQARFFAIGVGVALAVGFGVLAFRWSRPTAQLDGDFVLNRIPEGSTTQPIPPPVPVPKSLAEILAAHETPLPEINAWANAWTSAHQTAGSADTAARAASENTPGLAAMIEKSDLSAMDCLHFSEIIRHGGDEMSARAWEKAGVLRADKELAKVPHNDFSGGPLLEALGRANNAMWGYVPESAPLIETISNLGIKYDRQRPWDQRKEWSRNAHAAAIHYEGRDPEAWAETQGMLDDLNKPDSKWTSEQSGELHSFASRMLMAQGKFDAAMQQLELAGQMKGWPAHAGATQQAFSMYLSRDRTDDAHRVLDAYIKDNGNDATAARMQAGFAARAMAKEAIKEAE